MAGSKVAAPISGVGTAFASDYGMLYFSALCAGLGHGIDEDGIARAAAALTAAFGGS